MASSAHHGEFITLGNYKPGSPRLSNPSFQVPSNLSLALNTQPLEIPSTPSPNRYSEPFMIGGLDRNMQGSGFFKDNRQLRTPYLLRGNPSEGDLSLRTDGLVNSIDYRERQTSEGEFWRNKYLELERKYEENKISEERIAIILRNNEELNKISNQRLNEIEDLRLRVKSFEENDNAGLNKRLRELENRNRELIIELEASRSRLEKSGLNGDLEKDTRKLTLLIETQNKQIQELKQRDESSINSFKFNRLLEAFLLLGIEVDRLHAILKGRLQETKYWKEKVKACDLKIIEYEGTINIMKDQLNQSKK